MKELSTYTIKALKDNISRYNSTEEILLFLDISERDILEKIKRILSKNPEIGKYGYFDIKGYKTYKDEIDPSIDYYIANSPVYIPSITHNKDIDSNISYHFYNTTLKTSSKGKIVSVKRTKKEKDSILLKYKNKINEVIKLYIIHYFIRDERKFYVTQKLKYIDANENERKRWKQEEEDLFGEIEHDQIRAKGITAYSVQDSPTDRKRIVWKKTFRDFAVLVNALIQYGFTTSNYQEILDCFLINEKIKTVSEFSSIASKARCREKYPNYAPSDAMSIIENKLSILKDSNNNLDG